MFWGQGYEPQTEGEGDDIEDDELQEGGGAIVAISSPSHGEGSSRGDSEPHKSLRQRMLDEAVKAGDDAVVRLLRKAMSAAERKHWEQHNIQPKESVVLSPVTLNLQRAT